MRNPLTIFYADDDLDDLEFFKKIIQMNGEEYRLITHKNGDQLLQALENPPPSPALLFLDINMPGLNGLDVLKTLRESDRYMKLPIIMLSTTQEDSIVQKSLELGASYYVPKASNFNELKRSIEFALQINWGNFVPDQNNFLYHSN